MAESCCGGGNDVMILACSGGSNVGQLANQAAIELTQEGAGKMFCLAGVGAHLSGFVQSALDVPTLVAIDGCSVGCTKKILEHAEIPIRHYLVLTDEGIEKNKNFNLSRADVDQVKSAVKARLTETVLASAMPANMGCAHSNQSKKAMMFAGNPHSPGSGEN